MRRAAVLLTLFLGCASAPIQERPMSALDRAPRALDRVPLPPGARAVDVRIGENGHGIVALADGRALAVSARGEVSPLADDPPRDASWATSGGLQVNYDGRWFRLEAPPQNELGLTAEALRNVAQIVPVRGAKGGRELWIRIGVRAVRVRLEPGGAPGGAPKVTWLEAAPGVELGRVQSIARVDSSRVAVASDRGVSIVAEGSARTFLGAPPAALGAGGGWAWAAWNGQILRTDGEAWESLAKNVALGQGTRIAVDEGSGSFALVLDGAGSVVRIQADAALFTSGLADGATVFDTKIELDASASERDALARVVFSIDGKDVATRTTAPWAWGEGGARTTELASLGFGAHRVDVRALFGDGRERARTLHFDYRSPLGRVPTYEADIAPLYDARCGACHTSGRGVARDLSSYERLASQAPAVRASIREGRMPPDLRLDPVSASLFTAWIDGRTPK